MPLYVFKSIPTTVLDKPFPAGPNGGVTQLSKAPAGP